MLTNLAGMNISTSGAIDTLVNYGAEIIGTTWCSAPPGGRVTKDAFDRVTAMLCEDIEAAGPLDGVMLELHGAMVADEFDDAELEIVRRVRSIVGDTPIAVTVDLHANLSEEFVGSVECMDAYRTYPHVDISFTGQRVAHVLWTLMGTGKRLARIARRLDFLIPLPWQCTDIEPSRGVYDRLESLLSDDVPLLAFTPGFPASDVEMCGPLVFGYGDLSGTRAAVNELHAYLSQRENEFGGEIYGARDAVATAIARYDGRRPVIIADAGDNTGGGGTGDTTSLLRELIAQGAQGAVLAIMVDAFAAAAAHRAGAGTHIALDLGGTLESAPLHGEFLVEALSSGSIPCTGPMFGGVTMELGPMALIRANGVRVIVSSKAAQPADQAVFRRLGVDPSKQQILVLKSAVHFRNDFAQLASEILIVAAGGLAPIDPRLFKWTKLPPSMRRVPRGAQAEKLS
jgi:microcystin degradation protein MlrC